MQRVYPAPRKSAPPVKVTGSLTWLLVASAGFVLLVGGFVLAIGLGIVVLYGSGRILPGVSAAGIALGGMTLDDATAQLASSFGQITVRDGSRSWTINPAQIGLSLDASATALAAQQQGRNAGNMLGALVGRAPVSPALSIDAATMEQGITGLATTVNLPAANATIRLVNGQVSAVPAVDGRLLDVTATISRLTADAAAELADGALDLVMSSSAPTITDASALVDRARSLLATPLTINAFDPISNQTVPWSLAPDQWSQWVTTEDSPSGALLTLDPAQLGNYLNGQNAALGDGNRLDVDQSVSAIRQSIAAGQTSATIRIFHSATRYVISSGDTIGSIAWKMGIPMWRIQKANPGMNMDALGVGQAITIPSKDDMLPLPLVNNKRIVVSIAKQHMWVYENGQLKWDWVASTGIADSPTMPGVYQIQSHDKRAYAGNWNLWMPNFMGIYEAVPGFMNGIHGLPTLSNGNLLWAGYIGRPITYGCILLSLENAESLYNWAEEGVVVEIQR